MEEDALAPVFALAVIGGGVAVAQGRMLTAQSLLVQVCHGGSTPGLHVALARTLDQVRPPFGGVAVGPLAGGAGAVPGDGLVVEIGRVSAQLGGQFSTQTFVMLAARHYSASSRL
jgi:hypothetical protein